MIADCTAIILAGGDSRRMGRDKASLSINGETLLQSVIARVQPLFEQTLLSVREPRADVLLPQICDMQADGGPMVGLISALKSITTPWVFVVACDMPFVVPEVIKQLANLRADHQAVIPDVEGHVQPLAAFYARSCLPVLQQSLATGKKSLIGAIMTLDVRYVTAHELVQFDPQLRSFFDLDTPQDVALAQGMK
jgi:molybdopterin-guanine dinucleotide biosynthesis protein A